MVKSGALTPKQAAFIAEYIANGRNAAEAYRAAYGSKGNAGTVKKAAFRLLAHPAIAARISSAKSKVEKAIDDTVDRAAKKVVKAFEQYEVSPERVIGELARIGFANMADYLKIGSDGDPFVNLSALSREQAAAISEITVEDFKDGRGDGARDVHRIKFKLHDKRGALVDLGRTMALFKDRTEHSGPNGGPIQTELKGYVVAPELAASMEEWTSQAKLSNPEEDTPQAE